MTNASCDEAVLFIGSQTTSTHTCHRRVRRTPIASAKLKQSQLFEPSMFERDDIYGTDNALQN